jgi:hypothetical protein
MTDQVGGITRREVMTGIGLGAGALAGLGVLGAPLTAAAAPAGNHVAAWGNFPHVLGATNPNLAYAQVDGAAFWPDNGNDRYRESETGLVGRNAGGLLLAPLPIEPGSVVRQISFAYRVGPGTDASLQILENRLDEPGMSTGAVATVVGAGAVGVSTANATLNPAVTLGHGRTYTLSLLTTVGMTIRGVTVGYTPPAARFVPFAGAQPRALDTRFGVAKVSSGEEIVVDLGKAGARGALLNVTVTETEGLGFAAAFDASIAYPGNSSVNWASPGTTVANGVVSAMSADGKVKVRVGGQAVAKAHIIVDRLGWFI